MTYFAVSVSVSQTSDSCISHAPTPLRRLVVGGPGLADGIAHYTRGNQMRPGVLQWEDRGSVH